MQLLKHTYSCRCHLEPLVEFSVWLDGQTFWINNNKELYKINQSKYLWPDLSQHLNCLWKYIVFVRMKIECIISSKLMTVLNLIWNDWIWFTLISNRLPNLYRLLFSAHYLHKYRSLAWLSLWFRFLWIATTTKFGWEKKNRHSCIWDCAKICMLTDEKEDIIGSHCNWWFNWISTAAVKVMIVQLSINPCKQTHANHHHHWPLHLNNYWVAFGVVGFVFVFCCCGYER